MHTKTNIFFTAFILSVALPSISADEKVVTFENSNPTSKEIIQGFIGNETDLEAELPSELLPQGETGAVKFRGIRMKNSTKISPGCKVSNGTISLQVKFDVNSYALKKTGYKTLKSMATAMKSPQLYDCKFLIEGHTDASGDADYNRQLSEKRAQVVKTFLSYNDVDEMVMSTRGMGEDTPLNPDNPYAAENRRVQFKIINAR